MPAVAQRAPAPKADLTPDALDLGTAVLAAVAQDAPKAPAIRRPSPSPERKLASRPPPKPAFVAPVPRKESPPPRPQAPALAALTRPTKPPSPKPAVAVEIAKHPVIKVEPAKPEPEPAKPLAERAQQEVAPTPSPAPEAPQTEVRTEEVGSGFVEALPPPLPEVKPTKIELADTVEVTKSAELAQELELARAALAEAELQRVEPPAAEAEAEPAQAAPAAKIASQRLEQRLAKTQLLEDTADSSPAAAPVITRLDAQRELDDRDSEPEAPSAAPLDEERAPAADRPARGSRKAQGLWGAARIAFITTAAAALSYGVVRFAVAPRLTRPAADTVAAADSALPAPAVAVKAPAKAAPVVKDLELPAGIPVSPDKGLLEVELAERHALYVDGVFVGRGPTRRVPLEPGKHELEVRSGEGASEKHELDIHKGRRTRWELPAPPK